MVKFIFFTCDALTGFLLSVDKNLHSRVKSPQIEDWTQGFVYRALLADFVRFCIPDSSCRGLLAGDGSQCCRESRCTMYAPKVFRSRVLLLTFDRLQHTLMVPSSLSFVYITVCQLRDGKRDLYSRKTPFCLQAVVESESANSKTTRDIAFLVGCSCQHLQQSGREACYLLVLIPTQVQDFCRKGVCVKKKGSVQLITRFGVPKAKYQRQSTKPSLPRFVEASLVQCPS